MREASANLRSTHGGREEASDPNVNRKGAAGILYVYVSVYERFDPRSAKMYSFHTLCRAPLTHAF